MTPQWHRLCLVVVSVVVGVVGVGLWILLKHWWLFFAIGLAMLVCRGVFEWVIPARCPVCGARVRCRVIWRTADCPKAPNGRTVLAVATYRCPQCKFRSPTEMVAGLPEAKD